MRGLVYKRGDVVSKPRVQSAGGSKGPTSDGPIVVDGSTEIGHEPTSESAGGQISPPMLPARETPTDQGDGLDGMADYGGVSLTPGEIPGQLPTSFNYRSVFSR
ncbi:hypothetical protein PAAG_11765 [Paracoccidioides lutzii Pb01]|uniref:Uncharacterized protein n=1 Tax=Paracoccidioides lutzii (strain ATCC MYA-826 / Pb01) TaxID=502779 RepID=A0A0A2V202_PARBA|nr:hypothetical protein PAAG_11765 [Paracoccidioides lutzii Pb01]KGQ01528.1 hypothetical protein PAAG_11765 [Paracoccidioides lutzii Pb01]